MILHLRGVLDPDQVRYCREVLARAPWADGGATAGAQSAMAKHNLQLPEDSEAARILGALVLEALGQHAVFPAAALPLKVFPPLFNRYGEGMGFGDQIDNAIRFSEVSGAGYRTDLSCTLFLSDPGDYDGGELVIGDDFAPPRVKLPAGDMILYPATTVHRVEPITRGDRLAAFFWVQSLAPDPGRRALLYDMDRAIAAIRRDLGDEHPAAITLTGTYHNLIRMWASL